MKSKPLPIPSPQDLGLPPKYESWRPAQVSGFEFIRTSKRRVRGLVAPTGSGKTALALALGVLVSRKRPGARILILTETKGLQDIYADEGAQMKRGLVANISGANNYDCPALEPGGRYDYLSASKGLRAKVDNAPCNMGLPCKLRDMGCTYYGSDGALQVAKEATIVITNYANWLAAADAAEKEEKFGHFDWIVMDEGHAAADAVCNALAVDLDLRDVAHIKSPPPDSNPSVPVWSKWCRSLRPHLEGELEELQQDARASRTAGGRVPQHTMDCIKRLQRALRAIKRIATAKGEWVSERKGQTVKFRPVWPDQYCEPHLLRGVPNVLAMSATLVRQDLRNLGLTDDQYDFMEMTSSFPVKNRPVYLLPCARMRWNMTEEEEAKMLRGLDSVLEMRPDWRGIVHTVSYGRAQLVESRSKQRRRMIDHTPSATRDVVKQYKSMSPRDAVLVSPAISTGYDFPDNECRFQVLVKIPFPDTRDLVTKARIARDKKYLSYFAMKYIVQACGRAVRSESDYAEMWIIDSNALWFFQQAAEFAPEWFVPAVKKVSGISQAPRIAA